jgi:hypothetical protein
LPDERVGLMSRWKTSTASTVTFSSSLIVADRERAA